MEAEGAFGVVLQRYMLFWCAESVTQASRRP